MKRNSMLLAVVAALAAASLAANAATTVFHYSVNDTDAAGLPTIPSIGGSDGTAQGPDYSGILSSNIPSVGVPAGAGNRSIVGALSTTSDGVNSAASQELLNATVIANGGFTMEAWFLWNGGGNVNSIIDYAGTEKLRFGIGNLEMNYDTGNGGSGGGGSGPTILAAGVTTGEWHYIAMVFEHDGNPVTNETISGTMTWFYDDVSAPSGSASVTKSDFGDGLNRAIGVGRHPQGFTGDDFDGLIYEPRVTLGALSSSELLFVPEPGTGALLAFGLTAFLSRRRRR